MSVGLLYLGFHRSQYFRMGLHDMMIPSDSVLLRPLAVDLRLLISHWLSTRGRQARSISGFIKKWNEFVTQYNYALNKRNPVEYAINCYINIFVVVAVMLQLVQIKQFFIVRARTITCTYILYNTVVVSLAQHVHSYGITNTYCISYSSISFLHIHLPHKKNKMIILWTAILRHNCP